MKQGNALSPLLFNFAVEYAIRRVQVIRDGLKLNGTHQILVYADDVNILGGSVYTIKENAEALVVTSKKIGLEVNADKTKYSRVSICDDSLIQPLLSRTEHSRLVERHCRKSSVLLLLSALLAVFWCTCVSYFSILVQFF